MGQSRGIRWERADLLAFLVCYFPSTNPLMFSVGYGSEVIKISSVELRINFSCSLMLKCQQLPTVVGI